MPTTIRIRLRGEDARLGRIPAADVARLLLGVQRVVARASGHVIGRQVRQTGRWGVLIENAVRFRLVRLEEGSLVSVLELPDMQPEDALDLDVESLGELALGRALQVAAEMSTEADVAEALADWAEEIGVGVRYDSVTLEPGNRQQPAVVVDASTVERLRAVAAKAQRPPRQDTLTGLLFEADFERDTAHLRTPEGDSVAVSFGPELSDDIHRALRGRASLVGEIQYDPITSGAVSIRIREIFRPEQLRMGLGPDAFFGSSDVISRLKTKPGPIAGDDMSRLQDPDAPADAVDSLLAALEEL